MHAYCFGSGHIEFGAKIPEGALPVAQGPKGKLVPFIEGVARHAYDGETLLVPGVPEAPDQNAGVEALQRFIRWITKSAPDGVTTIHSARNSAKTGR